jgi:hypothetical protein
MRRTSRNPNRCTSLLLSLVVPVSDNVWWVVMPEFRGVTAIVGLLLFEAMVRLRVADTVRLFASVSVNCNDALETVAVGVPLIVPVDGFSARPQVLSAVPPVCDQV